MGSLDMGLATAARVRPAHPPRGGPRPHRAAARLAAAKAITTVRSICLRNGHVRPALRERPTGREQVEDERLVKRRVVPRR